MVSPEEQPFGSASADDAQARGEALEALLDALLWELTETRWAAIEQILEAMQRALAGGDSEAFAAATTDLELSGPFRITKIGAVPVKPPPQVRERFNQLVHALGGTVPEKPEMPEERSTGPQSFRSS